MKHVAIVGLILLLVCTIIFGQQTKTKKEKRWIETVGTHKPKGYNHGYIYYQVDGEVFSAPFYRRISTAVEGEKYTMRYNADNPEEVEIDYWHPIFLEGEMTYTVVGTVTKVVKSNFFEKIPLVEFSFYLGDDKFDRYIYMPKNYAQLFPDLHENQKYQVECFVIDTINGLHLSTGRIVLRLDKKIN